MIVFFLLPKSVFQNISLSLKAFEGNLNNTNMLYVKKVKILILRVYFKNLTRLHGQFVHCPFLLDGFFSHIDHVFIF